MKLSVAIKTLRESTNDKEKCKALLTYIRSNAMSTDSRNISEKQYTEICKTLVGAFINADTDLQLEICTTLEAILVHYKDQKLNMCQELLQTNLEDRVGICQVLSTMADDGIKALAHDPSVIDFVKDCLRTVAPDSMKWLVAESADDLKPLQAAEHVPLSSQKLAQEKIVNSVLGLIRRIYILASSISYLDIAQFDCLFLEKIATLAYMGHKRQRSAAIEVLQVPGLGNMIQNRRPHIWQEYKNQLQNTYCRRMALLVGASSTDWNLLWSTSVKLLGSDLHRGAGLINNLLSVEEQAFKSTDTVVRRNAFLCWKDIVDNFALDEQELATARRVKLLCIPLNAKNSKTEAMTLTKLSVWWHLINKLSNHIEKFINPVLTQFLNFCFGPLGDTPLLSSKFNVIASPGKRFPKTKLMAIDALLQLLSDNQNDLAAIDYKLDERLSCPISAAVFEECAKPLVHSVGEALVALSQFSYTEVNNLNEIAEILWQTLTSRIRQIQNDVLKTDIFKDIATLVIELAEQADDKMLLTDTIIGVIVPSLSTFPGNCSVDKETLANLVTILLKPRILSKINRNHHDVIEHLMWQTMKSNVMDVYVPKALDTSRNIVTKLETVSPESEFIDGLTEIWCILSEMVTRYMLDAQEINEGDALSHDFTTVQKLIKYPFVHKFILNPSQIPRIATLWKNLFKQFHLHADLIPTVKTNEIFSFAINMIEDSVSRDKQNSALAVSCLDGVLTTMNYKHLLAQNEFLSVIKLIGDICIHTLDEDQSHDAEAALKELSSVLITVFGHAAEKIPSCLGVIRPAIQLLLLPYTEESLMREIASTWETITSIFKGVGHLITFELMSDFEEVIRTALQHKDSEIVTQTLSWLGEQEFSDPKTKDLVKLLLSEVDLASIEKETDKRVRKEPDAKQLEQVRPSISMSTVRSMIPQPVSTSQKPSVEERSLLSSEPKPQEYVFIKSSPRLDVNRLTEHQKESLMRRREDIPALYNDLSQSCSQDMHHIQEWFDKRNAESENKEKLSSNNVTEVVNSQHIDPNKENKSTSKVIPGSTTVNTSNSVAEQCKPIESKSQMKNQTCEENVTVSETPLVESTETPIRKKESIANKIEDDSTTVAVAKKLDFESRLEFPGDKFIDENNTCPPTKTTGDKDDRQLSVHGEGITSNEEKKENEENVANATKYETRKKGVKRKAVSESDNDGSVSTRRRRRMSTPNTDVLSDSDSVKSTESEHSTSTHQSDITIIPEGLNKRTKTEISRLQINMVFDMKPLTTRRSKTNNDDESIEKNLGNDRLPVGDNNTGGSKSPSHRFGESIKKSSRCAELKDPKSAIGQESTKTRTRSKLQKQDLPLTADPILPGTTTSGSVSPSSNEIKPTVKQSSPKHVSPKKLSPRHSNLKEANTTNTSPEDIIENTGALGAEELDKSIAETPTTTAPETPETVGTEGCDQQVNSEDVEDMTEIIENSQESPTSSSGDRKYSNKQCFIKMNKIPRIEPGQSMELDIGNEKTKVTKGLESERTYKIFRENLTETQCNENSPDKPSNIDGNDSEMIMFDENTVKDIEIRNNDESLVPTRLTTANTVTDRKSMSPEVKRGGDTSSPIKIADTQLSSSSPKTNNRKFSKLKSVAPQGRAAHMLGMVTKQALVENKTSHIYTDDDNLWTKKSKTKDNDQDSSTMKKDRQSVLKEPERIGSPGSSRQEKIFSKMKSPNSPRITPARLFGPSKVDVETSSEVEMKNSTIESTISQVDESENKIDDDTIFSPLGKDPLPMLEWSSANPPSLTASPSASILKRYRHSLPEIDAENAIPPCKRKRVSFADPPVSKEMGYEITASTPPHRMSKLSGTRNLLPRKDSPVRLKQTRFKIIQINSEKSDVELDVDIDTPDMGENCDPVSNVDSTNNTALTQSLVSKTAENDTQESHCSGIPKVTLNHLDMEIEIASNLHEKENKNSDQSEVESITDAVMIHPRLEETETQLDMFDNTNPDVCVAEPVSVKDGSSESIRELTQTLSDDIVLQGVQSKVLNLTATDEISDICDEAGIKVLKKDANNDTTNTLSINESNREQLEDTVDIQNVTGLTSASNSEIFNEKPTKTNTTSGDAIPVAELDTLPVTDSVFSSLPTSQHIEHLLKSSTKLNESDGPGVKEPIFPSLIQSTASIDYIIDDLSSPIWKSYLSTYFQYKGIDTVGSLARLSEREISRIPVKRCSKIEVVKQVLQQFEHSVQEDNESKLPEISNSGTSSITKLISPNASLCSLPSSSPLGQSSSQSVSPGTSSNSLLDESHLSFDTSATPTKSTETQVSLEDLLDEVDRSVVLKSAMKRCSSEQILSQYRLKMRNATQQDLEQEIAKMLGIQTESSIDGQLKYACRTCGLHKVLGRLPDIFSSDKQFFSKVFKAYRKKLSAKECIDVLDHETVKTSVCEKCTSSELAEMLSNKLKYEEERGITTPMTELSSLNAMLKRMPRDLIISHTVANEELIPPLIVLDIALQNNTPADISFALETQPVSVRDKIFGNMFSVQTIMTQIEKENFTEESLVDLLKAVSSKIATTKLLDTFNTILKDKWCQERPDK